ncbi:MAG: hypothetical protein HC836_37235 [Richelia sp. RM2_1_2]|nr:hypothetical protein [Richelia sp. RM2_1_2]
MERIEKLINYFKSKTTWNSKDVVNKLGGLKDGIVNDLQEQQRIDVYRSSKTIAVDVIKRYDILYMPVVGTPHYFLVYKVSVDSVVGVIISSKDKVHSIHKIEKDRFLAESFATNTFVTIPLEEGYASFVRVYEDKAEADVIFKKIITFYTQLVSPRFKSFRASISKTKIKIDASEVDYIASEPLEASPIIQTPEQSINDAGSNSSGAVYQ